MFVRSVGMLAMLIIEYCDDGIAVRDCEAEAFVKEIVRNYCDSDRMFDDMVVKISNELVVNYLRVEVKHGVIGCDEMVFRFDGKDIKINDRGRLMSWPKGFCDRSEKIFEELI